MNCEICNFKNLKKFLDLEKQPIADHLSKNLKKSLFAPKYQIKVLFCPNCLTAFQKKILDKKTLFPFDYHYRARNTNDVINGMKGLVNEVENKIGKLNGKLVLDVGCNDGSLLDFFKQKKCKTYGVEPTGAFKIAKKNHKVFNCYIDKKFVLEFKKKFGNPDIITFTNVFAHIENLKTLCKNLNLLIDDNTIIIIENHYLKSVLDSLQFDTFYHEHLRTYSFNSFFKLSKEFGFKIINFSFPKRYGGNIRIYLKKNINIKYSSQFKKILKNEKLLIKKNINKFKRSVNKFKLIKKKQINQLNKKFGPMPGKSYPARASILINFLNLNKNNISAIYEKQKSKKINFYVPGTDIKIISDKYLSKINKKIPIINFAWHISKEIKNYLKKNNINNEVVDIVNKKDFNF